MYILIRFSIQLRIRHECNLIFRKGTVVSGTFSLCLCRIYKALLSDVFLNVMCVRKQLQNWNKLKKKDTLYSVLQCLTLPKITVILSSSTSRDKYNCICKTVLIIHASIQPSKQNAASRDTIFECLIIILIPQV